MVYWRRRAVVVGGALVVLLGFFLLLTSGGSGDDVQPSAAEATPTPTPSPDEGGTDDADGGSEAAAEGSGAAGQVDSSPSAAAEDALAPTCSDGDIRVTVAMDAESYQAGVTPQVTMAIANVGDAECSRDVGAAANEVVITSGGYHVWSSDDCNPGTTEDVQNLAPGVQAQVAIAWDRRLSQPGCAGDRPEATPGTYRAEGRNLAVTSEQVAFVLN